jgi:hypothetical protein
MAKPKRVQGDLFQPQKPKPRQLKRQRQRESMEQSRPQSYPQRQEPVAWKPLG